MEGKEIIEENIVVSTNKEYEKVIREGIKSFNNKNHPEHPIFQIYREKGYNDPFGFYALLDNQIIGGMIAHKKMQWLDIDILYVNENFRENKIGSHLINKAIEYCKKEELVGIHLYTLDFQAKGFYEKKGFKLIAEIKDWPKGITTYEFIKYINNDNIQC